MSEKLPASAYRPGDRVIGEDEDERIFGVVAEDHAEHHMRDGDVLVRWGDQSYEGSHTGHLVPAELLRLWPAAAHVARLAERLSLGAERRHP